MYPPVRLTIQSMEVVGENLKGTIHMHRVGGVYPIIILDGITTGASSRRQTLS